MRQRDEAVAALETERKAFDEKLGALERHRATVQQTEAELSSRFTRETQRLRRERDTLLRQRDELRERLEKMIEEQRQLLEEIGADPTRFARATGTDTGRPRAPKEANVIELVASDVEVPADLEAGINLPRVRPVSVPPPQVRIL